MRFRSLALLLPLVAVPASAATVHLKLQADNPQAGRPVKVTVKALSRVPVSLPSEPVVYVDEGQGFRPVRTCTAASPARPPCVSRQTVSAQPRASCPRRVRQTARTHRLQARGDGLHLQRGHDQPKGPVEARAAK